MCDTNPSGLIHPKEKAAWEKVLKEISNQFFFLICSNLISTEAINWFYYHYVNFGQRSCINTARDKFELDCKLNCSASGNVCQS